MPVSTYEDRIAALERKVLNLELRRLHNEQNAERNMPAELGRTLQELNENGTILLGLYTRQAEDIATIKENLSDIKEHAERVENRLDRLETKFDEHTALLTQILARLPEKP
ncbi:hypothetical protein KSD_03770 [Ktedonobacter sp. SOSP1-85]|nr:hypothetical protein KSD_03770 [Ktedonobacter sp. SOSP1-85]